MPEELFVSFVMIAYNEEENIARTIAAISELEGIGKHEVIVVDDGSKDGTAKIVTDIAKHNPCVRLIALAENRGRGYARSRGIAAARGGLIAMVDADIILPANWLGRPRAGPARPHARAGGRGGRSAVGGAHIVPPASGVARRRAALADHDAVGGIAVPDGDVAYVC